MVEGLRPFSDFFLQHHQYGIGTQGGLEAMIHAIQLSVELDPGKILVKWDVQNAFNEFLRQEGFDVLTEEFADVLHLVANFYSDRSTSAFPAEDGSLIEVTMTAGSSQGDVYGGLYFCAAFSKPLRKILTQFKDKGLELYAYYDDVYALISPRYVNSLTRAFRSALREVGLTLSNTKTGLYYPGGTIPSTVLPGEVEDRSNPEA